jgi:hypothetical protein
VGANTDYSLRQTILAHLSHFKEKVDAASRPFYFSGAFGKPSISSEAGAKVGQDFVKLIKTILSAQILTPSE